MVNIRMLILDPSQVQARGGAGSWPSWPGWREMHIEDSGKLDKASLGLSNRTMTWMHSNGNVKVLSMSV